jgi:hypothetical protein
MRSSRSPWLAVLPAMLLVTHLRAATPRPAGALPIIDVHTHPEFGGDSGKREEYLRQWNEAGLVAAVGILHTQDAPLPDVGDHNVIFCAGIVGSVQTENLEAGLKSHKYGCIKIYLGYEPYYASDPRYDDVYRLAGEYDVPVIFHTGDTDRARRCSNTPTL